MESHRQFDAQRSNNCRQAQTSELEALICQYRRDYMRDILQALRRKCSDVTFFPSSEVIPSTAQSVQDENFSSRRVQNTKCYFPGPNNQGQIIGIMMYVESLSETINSTALENYDFET